MKPSEEILKNIITCKSVSITGLGKNTGKTAVLNYLLNLSRRAGYNPGLTSIGLDGEKIDQVTGTEKPEVNVSPGFVFATAEKFFREKDFASEIIDVMDFGSSLGRLIVARALDKGKIILAGPSTVTGIKSVVEKFQTLGVDFVLIDGAISRLSPSSPFITGGVILATGAAFSLNVRELLKQTFHLVKLMELPEVEPIVFQEIDALGPGIWIRNGVEWKGLPTRTSLTISGEEISELVESDLVYVAGSITDRFLKRINQSCSLKGFTMVVKDYTRIFASQETLRDFLLAGGRIKVTKKPKLIAVTFNPFSPRGYRLDSREPLIKLREGLNVPVIDVFEEERL